MSLFHSQSNVSSRGKVLTQSSNQSIHFDQKINKKDQNNIKIVNKLKNIINKKLYVQLEINEVDQLCDCIQTIILSNHNHNKQQIVQFINQFQEQKHYNKRIRNLIEVLQTKIQFNHYHNHYNHTNPQRLNNYKNISTINNKHKPSFTTNFQTSKKLDQPNNTQDIYQQQTQQLKKRNKFYQHKISQITNQLNSIKGQLNQIYGQSKQNQQIQKLQSNQIVKLNALCILQKYFAKSKQQIRNQNRSQIVEQIPSQSKQNKQKNPRQSKQELQKEPQIFQKTKSQKIKINEPFQIQFVESENTQKTSKFQKNSNNSAFISFKNKMIQQIKLNKIISIDKNQQNSDNLKINNERRLINALIKKKIIETHKQQNFKQDVNQNNRKNIYFQNTTHKLIDNLDILNQTDEINIQEIQKAVIRSKKMKQYAQKLSARVSTISKAKKIQQIFQKQKQYQKTQFGKQPSERHKIQNIFQSELNCLSPQPNSNQQNQNYLNIFSSQNVVFQENQKQKRSKNYPIKINNQVSNFRIFQQNINLISFQSNLGSRLVVNNSSVKNQKSNGKISNQSQNKLSLISFKNNCMSQKNISQQKMKIQNNNNADYKQKVIQSNSNKNRFTEHINYLNKEVNKKTIALQERQKNHPYHVIQFQQIKSKSRNPSQIKNNNLSINNYSNVNNNCSHFILQNSYSATNVKYKNSVQKMRDFYSPQLMNQKVIPGLNNFNNMNKTNSNVYTQPIYKEKSTYYSIVAPYSIHNINQNIKSTKSMNNKMSFNKNNIINDCNIKRYNFKRGSRSKSSKGLLITCNMKNNSSKNKQKKYEYTHADKNIEYY